MNNTEHGDFAITKCECPESLAVNYAIRHQVFVELLGYESGKDGVECDEYDDYAEHFVMFEKETGLPVGCFRMVIGGTNHVNDIIENGLGAEDIELSRLIILPKWQNGAAIRSLLTFISQYSREQSISMIYAVMTSALSRSIQANGFPITKRSDFFELNGKRAVYQVGQRK